MMKLEQSFYDRDDVLNIARELIGKLLVTNFNAQFTVGRIVETEAYNGIVDKASHAYAGRRTKRTEIMFGNAGHAYVYLCYGIHHLFNVVTNARDRPHAVLIRAIEPLEGIDNMLERMNKSALDNTVGKGPGNVAKAMGINTSHTGHSLFTDEIFIATDNNLIDGKKVRSTTRVGVAYAAEDALLPYRFYVEGNRYVSSPPKRQK